MSEYDQRQYRLMLHELKQFENGEIHLDTLVDDLESLLAMLQQAEPGWKDEFLESWAYLDDERAIALDEGVISFDEATSERLLAKVVELRRLILVQIGGSQSG